MNRHTGKKFALVLLWPVIAPALLVIVAGFLLVAWAGIPFMDLDKESEA